MFKNEHKKDCPQCAAKERIMKVYRSEWKYALTNQELSLLKSRLEKVMELDPHTPIGRKIFNSFSVF